MKALTLAGNPEKALNTNSGVKQLARLVPIDAIVSGEPFSKLFPIKDLDLANIIASMTENGFDNSQPLHIWKERNVLIDGYTRIAAAKRAEIKLVPIYEHNFENESDALNYAISLQKNRRNLSDADLLSAITVFDNTKQKGKRTAEPGKSAEATAQKLGVSRATVERARAVDKQATDEQKEKIKSGETTINKVYGELKNKKTIPDDPVPPEADIFFDFEPPFIDENANVQDPENPNIINKQSKFDYVSYKKEWEQIKDKIKALIENGDGIIGLISFLTDIEQSIKKIIDYISEKENQNV